MTTALMMAGGTGGHIFPAMAVADELRDQGVHVAWMGSVNGLENTLVPAAGYPLTTLHISGLRGNGLIGWLKAPLKLFKAIREAKEAINTIKPDVVIGFGGFAAGPGGFVAWMNKIPLVIHEQNSIPGLTNSLLAKVATRVLTGFDDAFAGKVSNDKTLWVGNPVRTELLEQKPPIERFENRDGKLRLLVLGGSLGARTLNQQLPAAVAMLPPELMLEIRHQCGKRHIADCEAAYNTANVQANILPFIKDMEAAYAWADLVVCRAGALTVAELAAVGVGAILVPFPYAVDDHQTHNSMHLEQVEAAIVLPEKVRMTEQLTLTLRELLRDRNKLAQMATAAYSVRKAVATQQIADVCLKVAVQYEAENA